MGWTSHARRGATVVFCAAVLAGFPLTAAADQGDLDRAHHLLDETVDGGDSLSPEFLDQYTETRGPIPTTPAPLRLDSSALGLPAVFPVGGEHAYGNSFGAPRGEGRLHNGIDIFADKGVPVQAMGDGVVEWVRRQPDERCCSIGILHDNGWRTWYLHLNNDTAGTDDGLADGVVEGIESGVRVVAGQTIGWVGDSGNAEETPSHLHLEVRLPDGTITNPYATLRSGVFVAGDESVAGTLPFTGWDAAGRATTALIALVLGAGLLVVVRDRLRQASIMVAVERPDGTLQRFVITADDIVSCD
jgi:murein DD-endopeptidase MepM/ murein hydrolase activator NlpD